MQSVPLDIWKSFLPRWLDPRDLTNLSAVCKEFRVFQGFVHRDYFGNPNAALYRACLEGYRSLAEWEIDVKGADCYNRGLYGACFSGHQDIAEWIVDEKGANDFHLSLYGACFSGHQDLAKWIMDLVDDKGANSSEIGWGLAGAYQGERKDLVEWLKRKKK